MCSLPTQAPGYEYPEPDLSLGLAAGQAGNKVKPTTTTTEEPSEGLSLDAAGLQALQVGRVRAKTLSRQVFVLV